MGVSVDYPDKLSQLRTYTVDYDCWNRHFYAMKSISILVPNGSCSICNIEVSYRLFSEVNLILQQSGKKKMFDIKLVGLATESAQNAGMFTIKPDLLTAEVKKTDLIIVPAMNGDLRQAIKNNQDFIPWIVEHYNNGAEVASFCVGSFFLAATGLLKNKPCSTHWQAADEFRNAYPDVILKSERLITEAEGIYTSGGANSFLNLVLYLVQKYAGREMAIMISKIFMIDMDKISQAPFIVFKGQKEHKDEEVIIAQDYIEHNYQANMTVKHLTGILRLNRRNFERRFKKATCNTVLEYIHRVKIEAAKKGFETTDKNIAEIMWEVGYQDMKAFRNLFRKVTGLSPADYRRKYRGAGLPV